MNSGEDYYALGNCTHLVWSRSSFCLLCSTTSVLEHT